MPRITAPATPLPCADCQCSFGKLLFHFGRFPKVMQAKKKQKCKGKEVGWKFQIGIPRLFFENIAAPVSSTPSLYSGQLWVLKPSCQSTSAASMADRSCRRSKAVFNLRSQTSLSGHWLPWTVSHLSAQALIRVLNDYGKWFKSAF